MLQKVSVGPDLCMGSLMCGLARFPSIHHVYRSEDSKLAKQDRVCSDPVLHKLMAGSEKSRDECRDSGRSRERFQKTASYRQEIY